MSEASPDTHQFTAERMAHGGEAVGRLPDGRACFVAGLIPGEVARVRLVHEKKRWARAELVELLEASDDRVAAPCPHFGPCGGCQWQHIALPRQRQLKRDIVAGQLEHLGKLADPPVRDTLAVGPEDGFGYRNHVVFALDAEGHTCYHRAGSHELVRIEQCPLLHPLLQEWQQKVPPLPGAARLELRAGTRTAQRLAMAQGKADPAAVEESAKRGVPLTWPGKGELTEMVGIERFRVSSKSFFQVNTEGAEALVELVLAALEPGEGDQVVDLFAGVGLFSVPLARRLGKGDDAGQLWAVERSAAALRDLRHHSKGLPIHVVGVPLEEAASQLPGKVDLVVADPPREGLGAVGAQLLAQLAPRRIALVACDPAALARDSRALVDAGYELAEVVPVDLFPQTFHIEAVATLVRP